MKLPEINVLRLTFRLQAKESVVLPPFLGSTLRGSFGKALKKVFCFVPSGECSGCWFFEACPYQYIFESPNLIPREENHKLLRGQKEIPQPFIMIPPLPVQKFPKTQNLAQDKSKNFNRDYKKNYFSCGEMLEFSILLVGKAALYWAQILIAVRLMAHNGLGDNKTPFILTEALAHDSNGQVLKVFDLENQEKISASKISAISLARLIEAHLSMLKNRESVGEKYLRIKFQTPVRLRINNEISPVITFFDILRKISERLEFLAFLHAQKSQRIDYRSALEGAEKVSLTLSNLTTYFYKQFSNTQNKQTKRKVIMGEVIFQNNFSPDFLLFLAAGTILNIGTNTSYGFGQYTIEFCDINE